MGLEMQGKVEVRVNRVIKMKQKEIKDEVLNDDERQNISVSMHGVRISSKSNYGVDGLNHYCCG